MRERFVRTAMLLGPERMELLARAQVTVVGLGAVGSYAVEALARAGIGHLRLIDFDRVSLSNINRQLYALGSTVGQPKIEVASARVRDINPDCQVTADAMFVDGTTVNAVLAPRPVVVVDAIDSLNPKVELVAAAVREGVPIVSSMGAATRTDPSAVRTGDLSETRVCPLAQLMRKRLRRRGVTSGVRCVYSVEPVRPGDRALEELVGSLEEDHLGGHGRRRRPLGSVSYMTGIFGLVVAAEVLSLVAGHSNGRWLSA